MGQKQSVCEIPEVTQYRFGPYLVLIKCGSVTTAGRLDALTVRGLYHICLDYYPEACAAGFTLTYLVPGLNGHAQKFMVCEREESLLPMLRCIPTLLALYPADRPLSLNFELLGPTTCGTLRTRKIGPLDDPETGER